MPDVSRVIRPLRRAIRRFTVPIVSIVARSGKDPYRVLISCILSLRTRDKTTAEATWRLFKEADTPEVMLRLGEKKIAACIYPVSFYRNKSRQIIKASRRIMETFGGRVPDDVEGLLSLDGVGRKTANLVLGLGFGTPAVCVDTHVHRMSNRLGWMKTADPEQTEYRLRELLPRRYWVEINELFVTYGQNICQPVSPQCSKCVIYTECRRIGVKKRR